MKITDWFKLWYLLNEAGHIFPEEDVVRFRNYIKSEITKETNMNKKNELEKFMEHSNKVATKAKLKAEDIKNIEHNPNSMPPKTEQADKIAF